MSEEIGFAVVEWRQTGGSPYLVSDIYDDRDLAEENAADCRAQAASVGRRDRFAVAALTLPDDPGP